MSTSSRPFLLGEAAAARAELARTRAREFVALARHLAVHGDSADALGIDRLPDRVRLAVKAAVSAGALGDDSSRSALAQLSRSWLEAQQPFGAAEPILAAARQVPFLTRVAVSSTAIVATEVAEGQPTPAAQLSLTASDAVEPISVRVLTVLTRELAAVTEALDLIDRELRGAVAAGVDSVFLADMIAATTPIASAGSTSAATMTDARALLDAVTVTPSSRLFFVFEPAAAKALSTRHTVTWPDMTPVGGIISGTPLLTSGKLPAGTALLIDADQLAANRGEVEIATSTQADIQLLDSVTLDSSPEASDVLTSLWQHNLVGVRANRTFGYRLLRSSAVASLSGVSY